jgi:thiosulfate/3-mercaptopyruvate sulfurtransferase
MALPDVLIDAGWVQAHLDEPGVVPVEVDNDTSAYDKGHIKGAVKLNWKQDLQDPLTDGFIDKTAFEALLSERGIANDDTVILYGGSPPGPTGTSRSTGTAASGCSMAAGRTGNLAPVRW